MTELFEQILMEVAWYRYMRVTDIRDLFFSPTSRNYARENLSKLSGLNRDYPGADYLYRFPMPNVKTGRAEYVYTLGSKGREYLKGLGIEIDWYFRPSDYPKFCGEKAGARSYSHLKHALTLTSFVVEAVLFARGSKGEYELYEKQIEYTLRSKAARVSVPAGSAASGEAKNGQESVVSEWVVPDCWLNFYRNGKPYAPILVEIDRSTEQLQKFKRRIKALTLFIKPNGGYKRMFGISAVTIAFVTTGTDRRLASMLEWTREALEEIRLPRYAASFRLCRLEDHAPHTKQTLFLSPIWKIPGSSDPVSLLG